MKPFVSVDPAMQGGSPCLNHTRMTVMAAASTWWHFGDEQRVGVSFPELTIDEVRVSCWFLGRYGTGKWRRRFKAYSRDWDWKRELPPWEGQP